MPRKTVDRCALTSVAVLVLAIWSGRAAGQFALFVNETADRSNVSSRLFATDGEEKDYAWGDVDNDGDIDLIVVRKEPWTTPGRRANVLLINENGVLVDRTVEFAMASDVAGDLGFLTPTNDRDVILVDVDGDGWLDIVTAPTITDGLAKHISHPRVYINLGDDPPGSGNWLGYQYQDARIPQMHPTAGPRFCAVAAGDVTGDGAPDLYFADYDDGPTGQIYDYQNKLLINDGNGCFTDESILRMGSLYDYGVAGVQNYLFSAFGTAAAIADMNNDGVNDVVKQTALHQPYHQAVIYNDPDNEGFFDGYDVVGLTGGGYFISVGELNNDGILDIVLTNDGVDRYLIGDTLDAIGQRNYVSYAFPSNSLGFGGNSVIADLNNDGLNDVVIAGVDVANTGCSATTHVNRNLGGDPPSFSSVELDIGIPDGMLTGGHDVAIFDLNGDGWLDIIHGRCNSTEIWIQHPYGIIFEYPQDLPLVRIPDEPFTLQVQLTPVGGTLAPGTATLHYSINHRPFTSVAMTDLGRSLYEADLPPTGCLDRTNFYFSAEMVEEGIVSIDPPGAPRNSYAAVAADGLEVEQLNHFEVGEDLSGWTVVSDPSLTAGEWEVADPNVTIFAGHLAQPEDDATPGAGNVMAFITENGPPGGSPAANDVDGGPTFLISPSVDLEGTDGIVSFARWFFSLAGEADVMTVEISNDGATWFLVETVTGTGEVWETVSFLVSDHAVPSASVSLRFATSDGDFSVTEAGIDDFQIESFVCVAACVGDLDGDGSVGILDLLALLAAWGSNPGHPADFDGDGTVGILDLLTLLANWGPCP
ncbi:MAG: VCBS repeat-containing protein [Planctomycetes bacterium]|nr:VCBS repeat-containing protein [Planctomycetota bacterium]